MYYKMAISDSQNFWFLTPKNKKKSVSSVTLLITCLRLEIPVEGATEANVRFDHEKVELDCGNLEEVDVVPGEIVLTL